MASQIKTEMPSSVDLNAAILRAQAMRSEAMSEMLRGIGRGVKRFWARLHLQTRPAH